MLNRLQMRSIGRGVTLLVDCICFKKQAHVTKKDEEKAKKEEKKLDLMNGGVVCHLYNGKYRYI